jgi:hypothetical protein
MAVQPLLVHATRDKPSRYNSLRPSYPGLYHAAHGQAALIEEDLRTHIQVSEQQKRDVYLTQANITCL